MSKKKWLVAIVLLSLLSLLVFMTKQRNLSNWFVDYSLPLTETSRLFDIGVVDANGDYLLDVYTSNHHFRQSLLIADGKGGYRDVLSEWGLDQSREFPRAELSFVAPLVDKPGLYIYWIGTALVIRAHKTSETGAWKGSLRVNDPVEIIKKDNFNIQKHDQATQVSETVVEFSTDLDGKLVMRPGGQGLPVSFQLEGSTPTSNVYVGRGGVSPVSRNFSLAMQDRHAMAWADYNGDGVLDIYISRGALSGTLRAHSATVSRLIKDELLVSHGPGEFTDITRQVGVHKNDCSGRHVRWLDFNQDGLLDLYINCHDRKHFMGEYPKQLYLQDSSNHLSDVASEVGLGMPDQQIRSFAWIDFDSDGDVDLITLQDEGFFLHRNDTGRVSRELIHSISTADDVKIGQSNSTKWYYDGKLTVNDYDADGDLDLFSASANGNTLLSNKDGEYVSIEPTSVGLPANSTTARWVDYDNDGLSDLHAVPQGLFKQTKRHQFEPTELLAFPSDQFQAAISNWFDIDNDGRQDLLLAVHENPSYRHWWDFSTKKKRRSTWLVKTFRNIGASNHWLQIELIGNKGNRQGIGAQVMITTPEGRQVQEIGSTDGAFFSQGHYRLYFGLGKNEKADSVKIRWSDGYQQEITDVIGDKLLIIKREKSSVAKE